MNLMMAQAQLDSAPAEFVKWFFVIVFALILVVAAVFGIVAFFRKPDEVKLKDDPAIEVRKAAKRFNYDLTEQRYNDHERRILALEKAKGELFGKLESDKQEILDAGEMRGDKITEHVEAVRRELDEKIDNIPDRVITTLKNTGAI
ncbi:MAG: hypothetical protein NTZ16_12625 [Verrucomicrobia bacterium]|nr:hypothetical protein [Verrucomicrobiota bacterium]